MDAKIILNSLGFSKKESLVYLATLEIGLGPASIIAKKAGLKRPTVHEVLKALCARGYAERFLKNKIRYYSVLPPDALCQRYESYLQKFHDALPGLMAVYNKPLNKPKIAFFEGKEDLKHIYLDSLNTKGEILNYFLPEKPYEYFGRRWVDEEHIAVRVKKGIRLRAIMPLSEVAREYISRSDNELRSVRMISDPKLTFSNEVYIYDNKMSIFSFDEEFALIIESKDVVQAQKTLFELAWCSSLVKKP